MKSKENYSSIIETLCADMNAIISEIQSEKHLVNSSSRKRARKSSILLRKLLKQFRDASIAYENKIKSEKANNKS